MMARNYLVKIFNERCYMLELYIRNMINTNISYIFNYYNLRLSFTIKKILSQLMVVLQIGAIIVTILTMVNNQQVTNNLFEDLLNTSETLRIVSFFLTVIPNNTFTTNKINDFPSEEHFNQWLAGVIDGDGSLLISKEGYASCEITMQTNDVHTLMYIRDKLGGSVSERAGVAAYRYRLHNKNDMINLIHRINGNIRNSVRTLALIKVCDLFRIPYIKPTALNISNAWYSGFFDTDGCIYGKFHVKSPTIIISASNKYKVDVEPFLLFNGNIYYSKGPYGHYMWSISSRADVLNISKYFKKYPCRSYKLNRINMIDQFFELKDKEAYKENANIGKKKEWKSFLSKWEIKKKER